MKRDILIIAGFFVLGLLVAGAFDRYCDARAKQEGSRLFDRTLDTINVTVKELSK